jgi:FkbM family methyltransferase
VVAIHIRSYVRTGLTRMPWFHDAKARGHYAALRLLRRPFEQEFAALRPYLRRSMLCLDVGANRGQSIDALRMINRDVRVLAFEPQPRLFRRLTQRFPASWATTVFPFGVADRPGRTTMWVPSYNGCRFDGLASTTDERTATEWLSYSIRRFDPAKVSVEAYEIEIVRLDDVVSEPVGFIKLDIQGGELAALRGARRILTDDRPIVMLEQNTAGPIDEHMARLGYRPHAWIHGGLVDGIGTLNTLYFPDPAPDAMSALGGAHDGRR